MDMLKTTLPSSVTDDSLLKFGEWVIKMNGLTVNKTITTNVGSGNALSAKIVGDGHFWTDNTYTTSAGKSINIPAGTTKRLYVSAGTYEIIISGKYELRELSLGNYTDDNSVDVGRLEDLMYGNPVNFTLFDARVTGDVKCLSKKTNLISITSIRSNIYGNIDEIEGPINFFGTFFIRDASELKGNIASLGKFITLGTVNVSGSQVTGTWQDLAAAMASNGRTSGTCSITTSDGTTHSVTFPYSP